MEVRIGKIQSVRFGMGGYQDAQFGLSLTLGSDKENWGVGTFAGFWSMEPSSGAQWTADDQKGHLGAMCLSVIGWMNDAKVTDVAQLRGVPVEVTLVGGMLKSWRVLTEVI